MTIQELKAHAYDCILNIEMWQNELKATNQKIAEYKEPVKEKEEVK